MSLGENAGDDVNVVTTDVYVDEEFPANQAGAEGEVEIDGSTGARETAFIRFDVSSIPAGSTVLGATLHVATNTSTGSESSPGDQFTVHGVTEPWAENEATWTERMTGVAWSVPGCTGTPCKDTIEQGFFEPIAQGAPYSVALMPGLVQAWVDDASGNNGIVISTLGTNGADLHSSESPDTANRPSLEVEYCPI